jgi:hypothetical protein
MRRSSKKAGQSPFDSMFQRRRCTFHHSLHHAGKRPPYHHRLHVQRVVGAGPTQPNWQIRPASPKIRLAYWKKKIAPNDKCLIRSLND